MGSGNVCFIKRLFFVYLLINVLQICSLDASLHKAAPCSRIQDCFKVEWDAPCMTGPLNGQIEKWMVFPNNKTYWINWNLIELQASYACVYVTGRAYLNGILQELAFMANRFLKRIRFSKWAVVAKRMCTSSRGS